MIKKKVTILFLCVAVLYHLCILPKTHALAYTYMQADNTASTENRIHCYNDLVEACALGGTYMLADSISLKGSITIPTGVKLTILQEPGKNHSISSNNVVDNLFYVKPDATLTLGSSYSNPVILKGDNLRAYGSVISSLGNLEIGNASITSPNGYGIVCNTILFENGQVTNCKYNGISIYSNGTILNGSFSNCMYGIFTHPESTVTIQGGTYTNNQTAVYSKGNCTICDGTFSNCEYTLQSSFDGSIFFTGGIISDAGCWALDVSNGGSIYFTGGEIRNSRSTTYPCPDQTMQGNLYLGGSPYMDSASFIYCRTGSPIIQTEPLTAPSNHPDAKLQIAAYSQDSAAVIPASTDIQMEQEKDWYIPFHTSYEFVVKDNNLYANGIVPPYNGQLPTIRPSTSSLPEEEIKAQTATPTATCTPSAPAIPTSAPETQPSQSPLCTPTQSTDSLPEVDYSSFVQTAPTITKVTSKGLSFYLNWNFDCILSPDKYEIYCSTNRKQFTLAKAVKGSQTTATLTIPKAFKGKRMYFRIVATISGENTIYESKKSNLVSKYLLPKVTGTSVSYHTDTEKLVITWNKVTNCTGYYIYIKANSNGITSEKKCAVVSNPRHNTSISSRKIKRLFSQKGKPVHIKKCYVRAYYKCGNKIAYSP